MSQKCNCPVDIHVLAERVEQLDKQYTERHVASEKAIVIALTAQKEWNDSHNDLLRRMDKQYEETFPRKEFVMIHAELVTRVEADRLANSKELQALRDLHISDMSHLRETIATENQTQREAVAKDIQSLRDDRTYSNGEKEARSRMEITVRWAIGVFGMGALIGLVNLVHYWIGAGSPVK